MQTVRCRILSATVILFASVALSAEPPKGIDDAVKVLEKALADSKDPAERAKLKDAIAALNKIGGAPKIQNALISEFVDNTAKFKGETLTFKLTYADRKALNMRINDKSVPFVGHDPKNKAKLLLGLDIPAGLVVPAAKEDEEVIITFKCNNGATDKGNVAVSIIRP